MEGKNPTLFYAHAIVAGYFLNFFYTVTINSGWVMMARKPSILVCFGLCLVTKRPLLSSRIPDRGFTGYRYIAFFVGYRVRCSLVSEKISGFAGVRVIT